MTILSAVHSRGLEPSCQGKLREALCRNLRHVVQERDSQR